MLLLPAMRVSAQVPDLTPAEKQETAAELKAEEDDLDVKEIIFHHLGDGYGFSAGVRSGT